MVTEIDVLRRIFVLMTGKRPSAWAVKELRCM